MLSEQLDEGNLNHDGETALAGTSVVVRRRAGLAALIGAGASAVAIAYLWRASQSMLAMDWALCGVMTVLATLYLATFVDSRTPLLVADHLGVRIRLGQEWRGLPWDAINEVVVRPRRGLFGDGRIVLVPHSLARALEGLEGKARRQAKLNQKMYGAALAVPLGITTRVSTTGEQTVAEAIADLMRGRADVVEIVEAPAAPALDTFDTARVDPAAEATDGDVDGALGVEVDEQADQRLTSGRTRFGGLGTIVSRARKGRRADVDGGVDGADAPAPLTQAPTLPLRETRPALRAEVTRDTPATMGSAELAEVFAEEIADDAHGNLADGVELCRPGSVNLVIESDRIRPISTLGDPVEPLVIDDYVTEPAYNPVIGPELAASRTRIGLTVDQLADRTRIRPHVIESIEVDDFAPCGGDFYARGHLRTMARLLAMDPAPLLATFEERYATAPVNARRVFEAELASGTMGSRMAGPKWGLLIGVVLSLILVWGAVRLVSGDPASLVQSPAPVLSGPVGIDKAFPAAEKPARPAKKPLPVTLVAAHADSSVTVRNGHRRIVFSGEMLLGQKMRLEVMPPVRIFAVDGGAIEVVVRCTDRGVLGVLGEPGHRTFRWPPPLNQR